MRIHIGKISPSLAEKINELESRLARYGKLEGGLTLHRKPYGDFYFAFADMDIDQKQYGALRTAFNGVTFRQSKLELKLAKPSYLEKVQSEAAKPDKPVKLSSTQIKRAKSVNPRRINVFPGRFRDIVRPTPTFRVNINGEIRKPRMRKRKLWGVEKRPFNKLVHHFVDGEWRDAEDKAVEIVAELHDEHARDLRIVEDIASTAFLSDSDFDEFKENARTLDEVDTDDEIEVVSNSAPLPPKTTTESLRSALTADAPFTLFGQPEDVEMDVVEEQPRFVAPIERQAEPKVGLFFSHSASPYLRSQTQAAKLVDSFDKNEFETEFYAKRGEWNRALRQRQREAVKRRNRMGKKRGE